VDYKKGDICKCIIDYEYGIGSKPRPVVFWDDWKLSSERPTVLVIPFTKITSKQRYQPTFYIKKTSLNNLEEDSILKLYQFACVSKNNLGKVIGRLNEDEIVKVEKLLQKSFPSLWQTK